jgi:metallo-beta-lactamase class B
MLLLLAALAVAMSPEKPVKCASCEAWNAPQAPFRVFGNTWYVGTSGLSSVVVATPDGLVLLDAGLPQSAPVITANLAEAGFRLADVEYILVSHAHFDHVGGVAAMADSTGAEVVGGAEAVEALARGRPSATDPQPSTPSFAKVRGARAISDGDTVALGGVVITAHRTPGHTPGGTSWSWRSCEGEHCVDVVYADSLNPVSDAGYRFTDHPEVVAGLRNSIDLIRGLPCDVLISVHPGASHLFDRLAKAPDPNAFVDPTACVSYADAALAALEQRLAEEAQ